MQKSLSALNRSQHQSKAHQNEEARDFILLFSARDTLVFVGFCCFVVPHFLLVVSNKRNIHNTIIMSLVSYRSLLFSSLLVTCVLSQVEFEEKRLSNNGLLGGIWLGEEKFPYEVELEPEGRRMEMGRFCSRVSMDHVGFRTYFAAEDICNVRNLRAY